MKERLILAGLIFSATALIRGSIESVSVHQVEPSCKAVVLEHPLMRGGMAIPLTPDGKASLVVLKDRSERLMRLIGPVSFWWKGEEYTGNTHITLKKTLLDHELGHVQQICEEGSLHFIQNYFSDRDRYEADADRRAGVEE